MNYKQEPDERELIAELKTTKGHLNERTRDGEGLLITLLHSTRKGLVWSELFIKKNWYDFLKINFVIFFLVKYTFIN